MSPVLRVSAHIHGISQEIDGKSYICWVKLDMWPLRSNISEKWALFWGFQHTFMDFSGDRWEILHLLSKARHVTPQIDHPEKWSPVLRVSTHIYRVSKYINGKTLIFQVNLGMWPLKSNISEKGALFGGFLHTFMGFLRREMEKYYICSSKAWHVTIEINHFRKKWALFWECKHTFMGFLRRDMVKHSFLRVNLDMWPLKLIVSEKEALFWRVSTQIYRICLSR